MKESNIYQGISASPGIVIGKAFIHTQQEIKISQEILPEDRIDSEVEKFMKGRDTAKEQMEEILKTALETLGPDKAEIFEGHIEILMDEEMCADIKDLIRKKRCAAEAAIKQVVEKNALEFSSLNSYMAERAADIRDIGKRLLYATAGIKMTTLEKLKEKVVVIAHDLTPSDTAQMDRDSVVGIVTETGGMTSHVAIMARTFEIPAIVGTAGIMERLKDGDTIILDGPLGSVIVDPDERLIEEYRKRINIFEINMRELSMLNDLPAETLDGHRVEICANIGNDREVEGALKHGAEGIGLFRTEFLYMDKPRMPSEEEQFIAYKNVAEAMKGRPVIIRTMDIGGDKELPYLQFPKEQNPFLGWRAIRVCLDMPEILVTQLRAILRASYFGKVRIMYPMIISLTEIELLKAALETVKDGLRKEGILFDENIETGIMIETPAAAVIAKSLIRAVDFFSIGTNDLTQYTLAVDRGNEKISALYQPLHPSVVTLIKNIIDASHGNGKWTGMCGEMASDEKAALLLTGLGLDEFSMSPVSINRVKSIIRKCRYTELRELADRVVSLERASDINDRLENFLKEIKSA